MSEPNEGWAGGELALQTVMVVHVEQIVPGSAAVVCAVDGCDSDAVLYIASEPDMEPGPVCAEHGHSWLDLTHACAARPIPACRVATAVKRAAVAAQTGCDVRWNRTDA